MGILDVIRAAIPIAATARAGYLGGEREQQAENRGLARQSMLDQIKQAMDQSTIDENEARAESYRNQGVPVTWKVGPDGSLIPVPSKLTPAMTNTEPGATSTTSAGPLSTIRAALTPSPDSTPLPVGATGTINASPVDASEPRGPLDTIRSAITGEDDAAASPRFELGKPSSIKVRVPATNGPHIIRPNVVNPASGNVEDVYSDGTRRVIRKATADELARATRVPGSGTADEGRSIRTEAQRQALASKIAMEAVIAADGDPIKAMQFVEQQPDKMALARTAKVTRGDYYAAASQWARQHQRDVDAHARNAITNQIADEIGRESLDAVTHGPAAKPTRRDEQRTRATAPRSAPDVPPPTGTTGDVTLGGLQPSARRDLTPNAAAPTPSATPSYGRPGAADQANAAAALLGAGVNSPQLADAAHRAGLAPGVVRHSTATTGRLSPTEAAAMQAEIDEASRKLSSILASTRAPDSIKARAQVLYGGVLRDIARKYGLLDAAPAVAPHATRRP